MILVVFFIAIHFTLPTLFFNCNCIQFIGIIINYYFSIYSKWFGKKFKTRKQNQNKLKKYEFKKNCVHTQTHTRVYFTLLLSCYAFFFALTHTPNFSFYWTISIFIVRSYHEHTTDLSLSSFTWESKWFRMHDTYIYTDTRYQNTQPRQRRRRQQWVEMILKINAISWWCFLLLVLLLLLFLFSFGLYIPTIFIKTTRHHHNAM